MLHCCNKHRFAINFDFRLLQHIKQRSTTMITITFTAIQPVVGGKRRKLNYIPFSVGMGSSSGRTRKHKVRKHKVRKHKVRKLTTSTSVSESLTTLLTTYTMGKRSHSSLSEVDPYESFKTFDPSVSVPPQIQSTNKRMKFTVVDFGDDEVATAPSLSTTPFLSTTSPTLPTINEEPEEEEEPVMFFNFGDDEEEAISPSLSTTPSLSTNSTMGSIIINNVRRSARILNNNPMGSNPMGSIMVNGIRRSARLMSS